MAARSASGRAAAAAISRNARALIAIGIVVFAASIYLLTSYGRGYSSDGGQYYYTADAFLDGRIHIDADGARVGGRLSADGHYYSKAGPGQSIVELPSLVALRILLHFCDVPPPDRLEILRAWGPILTNALLSGALAGVMYLLIVQWGYRSGTALVMGALVAFTTPIWIYAKQDLSEPLQCLLLLVAFWTLLGARPPHSVSRAVAAGLAIGLLILAKSIFILLAPTAWAALLWQNRPLNLAHLAKLTLALGVPIMISGLLYLGWNYARWGSPLDFGYANETFDTPLLLGLYGLFFSSGKSVFLYAPVLVAALFAAPRFARRHPFASILVCAFSVPFVCVYASYWAWHGDWSWGPRYMLPFMALWMLPVATALEAGSMLWRGAVGLLAALGLFVQILGISITPGNYLNLQTFQVAPKVHGGQKSVSEQAQIDVHFVPEFSPLAGHFWLLKAAIERLREPGKSLDQYRALHNYPWLRSGLEYWRADHPEYGAILDFWLIDPPKEMGLPALRTLRLLLIILGVVGLALIVTGARGARRASACRLAIQNVRS